MLDIFIARETHLLHQYLIGGRIGNTSDLYNTLQIRAIYSACWKISKRLELALVVWCGECVVYEVRTRDSQQKAISVCTKLGPLPHAVIHTSVNMPHNNLGPAHYSPRPSRPAESTHGKVTCSDDWQRNMSKDHEEPISIPPYAMPAGITAVCKQRARKPGSLMSTLGRLALVVVGCVLLASQTTAAEAVPDLCTAGGWVLQEQCSPLLHLRSGSSICCSTLRGLQELGCFW